MNVPCLATDLMLTSLISYHGHTVWFQAEARSPPQEHTKVLAAFNPQHPIPMQLAKGLGRCTTIDL
jgi:hypothetical protein